MLVMSGTKPNESAQSPIVQLASLRIVISALKPVCQFDVMEYATVTVSRLD
jgi:hypothetical protein